MSPEASIRLISTIFVCYSTPFLGDPDSDVKTFSMHTVGHHSLFDPFRGSNEPRSEHKPHFDDFRVIAHHFLGDPDSDVQNAKFFHGRPSTPCLCIRLAITACPTHLEGQMSPEVSIRLISTIFVCYSTPFLGDPYSDVKNAKFFCGRPSRSFSMHPVVPHSPSHPF